MNVPFIDLKLQYSGIKEEIKKAIDVVLENSAYVLGKSVSDFEKSFAEIHKVNFCYGVSSGTDGNHLVLWGLGIKPGDEVIIPANTFIATVWGATLCGAKPVFVDCHRDSYNIDPDKIEEAITPKTKAIVAVHLYGQPADMDALSRIAEKHNLILVEDCAQAHLSEYKNIKVGGLSKASSFSFYPGKNLGAYGEGGAVVTNDTELAEKFRMMRDHGSPKKYLHTIFGTNYRMEGIQGAVLGVKLKYLEKWTEKRRNAAKAYNDLLKDVSGIKLPVEMPYSNHVYHLFVLQVREKSRDDLSLFLNQSGISTGLHYPIPLHLQPCFEYLGYKRGDFPVTEKLADSCISLPIYPEIEYAQIEYVCDKIKKFINL